MLVMFKRARSLKNFKRVASLNNENLQNVGMVVVKTQTGIYYFNKDNMILPGIESAIHCSVKIIRLNKKGRFVFCLLDDNRKLIMRAETGVVKGIFIQ